MGKGYVVTFSFIMMKDPPYPQTTVGVTEFLTFYQPTRGYLRRNEMVRSGMFWVYPVSFTIT